MNKIPLGGVIAQSFPAKSMVEAIENPITFYGSTVINQAGHSRDLYNYYWSSYSRGVDGTYGNTKWHNDYLDGYIPLRVKSIYDPCPYLYHIPSNGTYNQFEVNAGWTVRSYLGGGSCNINTVVSWFSGLGRRNGGSSAFERTGEFLQFFLSTIGSPTSGYSFILDSGKGIHKNRQDYSSSNGFSVRCIEPHC